MIICIFSGVFMQCILVYFNHRYDSHRLKKEIIATLTFTKPALNIFRVLTKQRLNGHEMLDHTTELVYFKACKLVLESIPCTVLQFAAFMELEISAGELTYWGVVFSLLVSALATSHTVMYMSYIKDITITNKTVEEDINGFVPLSGRNKTFVKAR